jgi:glycosyltransferase involved in cell wall biosynthesis
MPEMVKESRGGFVYQTEADIIGAMDKLLRSPEQRVELGLNGYNGYRKNWTPDAHLKRYFEVISYLAAARRASSVQERSKLCANHSEFIGPPLATG